MGSRSGERAGHDVFERGLIIAMVSAKGAPGVTTGALGLAARWPQPGAVILEADPAGGDLAARFGRHFEPGLAAMALDSRGADPAVEPQRWLQRLPCGVSAVLAAPGTAAAASLAELGSRASRLLRMLARQHPVVIVDGGRWQTGSAADPALAAADVVLVVTRSSLEAFRQVEVRLDALRSLHAEVRLLLAGEGGWPSEEVAASLGVPVAGALPADEQGAALLDGRSVPRRGWESAGWTRLPLLRACRGMALQLHESFPGAGYVPSPDPIRDSAAPVDVAAAAP